MLHAPAQRGGGGALKSLGLEGLRLVCTLPGSDEAAMNRPEYATLSTIAGGGNPGHCEGCLYILLTAARLAHRLAFPCRGRAVSLPRRTLEANLATLPDGIC